MHLIFNGRQIRQDGFSLMHSNRSFLYGDGLFETIIVKGEQIRFFSYHFDRLTEGMKVLKIEPSGDFQSDKLSDEIITLTKHNNLNSSRVKLHVWRADGGLYSPSNNQAQYMITTQQLDITVVSLKQNASFSETVRTQKGPYSKFKTCSSLPYILASIEKKERGLDEIIILDNNGFVSECSSSNIFWFKEGTYYTPSLQTGCIEGIMRRHIIMIGSKKNIPIHTGCYQKEELLNAEKIFSCNATGCFPIQNIDGKKYDTDISIIPLLEL